MLSPPDISQPLRAWMPVVIYPGYRPELPDVVLGRWPPGLTTEQFKPWFVETPQEMQALMAALDRPVPTRLVDDRTALDFRHGPDATVSRRGRGEPFAGLYLPPEDGWPWLAVYRWPRATARQVGAAREAYTWDAYDSEAAALSALTRAALMVGGSILKPDSVQKS